MNGSRTEATIQRIRRAELGGDAWMTTPFGERPVVYTDYAASARPLRFLEDALREHVLPWYANTHTESSATGRATTWRREEARGLVRRALGASRDTAIVFCGSGSTGAINALVEILGLRLPETLDRTYHLRRLLPEEERPVVLIGPYEHHSNELPWRESIADVLEIGEDTDGAVDLTRLERRLQGLAGRRPVIGSFSAGSNVTGILAATHAVTALLHRYGALAFWDYGAAAPYVAIEMDGDGSPGTGKDAIFISPHKLPGGPGTPGVLAVRRALLTNAVPHTPGGGTVSYVSEVGHHYLADLEHREEGGTPAIIESIRCGLAFQLKETVGVEVIQRREEATVRRVLDAWSGDPNIELLGGTRTPRLPIVSILIRHGRRYLHHNAVVAMLNDLFGIQTRGGCSCAGPYGHRLLHIGAARSQAFEEAVACGGEGLKPGWVRFSFSYFMDPSELDYLLSAVTLVAAEGWKLLPEYRFHVETGLWTHRDGVPPLDPPLAQLADPMRQPRAAPAPAERRRREYREYLAAARRRLAAAQGAPESDSSAPAAPSRRCAGSICPPPAPRAPIRGCRPPPRRPSLGGWRRTRPRTMLGMQPRTALSATNRALRSTPRRHSDGGPDQRQHRRRPGRSGGHPRAELGRASSGGGQLRRLRLQPGDPPVQEQERPHLAALPGLGSGARRARWGHR